MDIQNSEINLDIKNEFWISKNDLWISINTIMDIHKYLWISIWIFDSEYCWWIFDIENSSIDIHNSNFGYWTMNYGYQKLLFSIENYFLICISYFSISMIPFQYPWMLSFMEIHQWFVDIQNLNYEYWYTKFIGGYRKMNFQYQKIIFDIEKWIMNIHKCLTKSLLALHSI